MQGIKNVYLKRYYLFFLVCFPQALNKVRKDVEREENKLNKVCSQI